MKSLKSLPLLLLGLAGCGIPPLDPTFISDTPANASSYAVAKQAVLACKDLYDSEKVFNNFRSRGFGVSFKTHILRNGRQIDQAIITSPDPAVTVIFGGGGCYVGLESMTPDQAVDLVQPWVYAYEAKSNAEQGDGLSDHVAGAWRNIFQEVTGNLTEDIYKHRTYIAAYKTWPQKPYDPQSRFGYDIDTTFPQKPGAAVSLRYAFTCKAIKVILPDGSIAPYCTERPSYRPR